MDHRNSVRRDGVLMNQGVAGVATVRHDVSNRGERAEKRGRQCLSGPHRGYDGASGKFALKMAAIAICHATHAESNVWLVLTNLRRQPGRKPIEPQIEWLQGAPGDVAGNRG